jgi:probable addiction module antidote protein
MVVKTSKWDVADYLDTPEMIKAYLDAALEENDPVYFAMALGNVARSKGVAKIARSSGVSRETIYTSLEEGRDPRLSTVFQVLQALGVHFCMKAAGSKGITESKEPAHAA